MAETYGHRIAAIHANPKNLCNHCGKTALWETDFMYFGEHMKATSNPEQVCDTHARAFADKWPSANYPPNYSKATVR